MSIVKHIQIKVLDSKTANDFVKKNHYSGKVVANSVLHFGAFYDNKLHGVMSYGSPMDKKKVLPLVEGTGWNEMLELNRMAFDEFLPKNSESRCLAISFNLIKKNAPHIKWILSFSDGCQSGDGTIYRATGFVLTQIKKNTGLIEYNGEIISRMTLDTTRKKKDGIGYKEALQNGGKKLEGYQLRYIKLLRENIKITCNILPYSDINKYDAGMYRGIKRAGSVESDTSKHHFEEDGALPIPALSKEITNE
jgi:hypothetical protein